MSATASARFRLNEDDLVHAAGLYARDHMAKPRTIVLLAGFFLAALLVMAFAAEALVPFNPDRLLARWWLILGAALAPFAIVFVASFVLNPILARRNFRQQRSLQGEIQLSWTEAGLDTISEYGQFFIPWSHFLRWTEDSRLFLIYESNRLYRPVPKRVLDPDQQQALRTRLAAIQR